MDRKFVTEKKKVDFITDWAYKTGVFLTPQGDYIVRVKMGKKLKPTTIGKYKTEEEATKVFNSYK